MTDLASSSSGPVQRPLLLLAGLIVAGLAGNYFKFSLFLNIDFLFGSVFAMLALQYFGLARGIVAGALIASYTFVLWNHPYAIAIMTTEVAVVGWLMERRKMGMLLADTLYWLIVGMPMVFVFYYLILNVPLSSAYVIMVKQALNGVTCALLARLVFTGLSRSPASAQMPLPELVGNLLVAFLLVPALAMLAVSSRTDFSETDESIRNGLQQRSLALNTRLDDWVQERTQAVVSLAELAATLSAQQMQARLEQARNADNNFLRLGLRDTESTIAAYAPAMDESGQSNIGKHFPERPYVAEMKRTLKPMLAEVMVARIDKAEPIAILSAPVLRQGHYAGYVNAVLRLSAIRKQLQSYTEGDTLLYTLLDSKGNTILSNRQDQKVMTPFVRGPGALQPPQSKVRQWIPALPPNTSISDQWKNSYYVAESTVGDLGGWQLVLEQPVAPFQKMLYDSYTRKLSILYLALLVALGLAELLSRKTTNALDRVSAITHDLPLKLAGGSQTIDWPHSRVVQTSRLIENFKAMADSMAQQFGEIHRMNDTLEARVQERTQALAQSESRFRLFVENNSSVMLFIDPQTGVIEDANAAALTYYGHSKAQLTAMRINDINTLTPQQIQVEMQRAASQMRNHFLFQHRLASGEVRDVEVYSTPIETGGHNVLFSIVHDITERKIVEAERDANRDELVKAQIAAFNLMEDAIVARDRAIAARADLEREVAQRKQADESLRKLSVAVEQSPLSVVITDLEANIEYVNPRFTEVTGYSAAEAIDSNPRILQSGQIAKEVYLGLWNSLTRGLAWHGELLNRRKDGSLYWEETHIAPVKDPQGTTTHYVAVKLDITERKQMEDTVRQLAFYDGLTGLANRRLLDDRLGQSLLAGKRSGRHSALLFLDLDNFKPLNDSHGHSAGDLLLIEAANRLKTCVRETDTVARFGGDEFVVLLSELTTDRDSSTSEAARVAEKVRSTLAAPYVLELGSADGPAPRTTVHQCSASIGVAVFGAHESTAEEAMRWADKAMYDAKELGRNRVCIFGT